MSIAACEVCGQECKTARRRFCSRSCMYRGWSHGQSQTAEYKAWAAAKRRCTDSTSPDWSRYGGRGILMCERWLERFEFFLADMGRRPSDRYSLDRGDNEGPYSPENCRWATTSEQATNRRTTAWLTIDGVTRSTTDWANEYGIRRITLHSRLARGWSVRSALETPIDATRRRKEVDR